MGEPKADSISNILSALASLVSALAWPALVAVVLFGLYRHSDALGDSLRRLIGDSGSAKFSVSPTSGLSLEIVQKTASVSANAVIESAKKSDTGALNAEERSQVKKNAEAAAVDLASVALDPRKRFKILWVDDHPENNIDLQYAFQTLGIIVICIDSNNGVPASFDVASAYDLVITDMGRDKMGDTRPDDREGGLKTVGLIKSDHPNIPVIIYAGSWAAKHRSENLGMPVIKITNYPQELYELVVKLAKKKAVSS